MTEHEESNVLVLCMRDCHKTKDYDKRCKLKDLAEATSILKKSIAEEEGDIHFLVEKAAKLSGTDIGRFKKKLNTWSKAWDSGLWCKKCKQRPVKKGNRYFCSQCFSSTSSNSDIIISGGGGTGRAVRHTSTLGRSQ